MYSLEILLVSIGVSATAASLITYWFLASSSTKKKALKMESELLETREAFENYRREVFNEFSETATKFNTLNKSYVDLHQHLAKSANTLCGEAAASSLLEAPSTQKDANDTQSDQEQVIDSAEIASEQANTADSTTN